MLLAVCHSRRKDLVSSSHSTSMHYVPTVCYGHVLEAGGGRFLVVSPRKKRKVWAGLQELVSENHQELTT